MSKENLRMQMLAGIITEGQYKEEIDMEVKTPYNELVKSWMELKKDWPMNINDKVSLARNTKTNQIYIYFEEDVEKFIDSKWYKIWDWVQENGYEMNKVLNKPKYVPGLGKYSLPYYTMYLI
jgi:hypothetical protein